MYLIYRYICNRICVFVFVFVWICDAAIGIALYYFYTRFYSPRALFEHENPKTKVISVQVNGWQPIEHIDIRKPSTATYVMEPVSQAYPARVLVTVSVANNITTVSFSGPYIFQNDLGVPIEVSYNLYPDIPTGCLSVAPGETKRMPVIAIYLEGVCY